MRVLVAQLGARRHYAVPVAFASHGWLAHFCTDFYVRSAAMHAGLESAGRWSGARPLSRLAGRRAPMDLRCQLSSFWWPTLRGRLGSVLSAGAAGNEGRWIATGRAFARGCAKGLDANIDGVYAFSSAAYELFESARGRGIATWLDHATAPRSYEMALVAQEAERFPGWAINTFSAGHIGAYEERQKAELDLADVVVCGSSFAKRAVQTLGVEHGRLRVVPLGLALPAPIGSTIEPRTRSDKGLKVLFVGGEGLRKGIGYLAQALAMLNSKTITAKAAGNLEISTRGLSFLAQYMELLGPVPRGAMGSLFAWADVLVLPSVSDTFGIVILEAMAHGVPVIATDHTGAPDILREGVDGFVVPVRDVAVLAERIQRVAGDRELLSFMQESARLRAADFDLAHYANRLIEAVSGPQV